MDQYLIAAILVVALALVFNFSNGFHDSANQVAAVITSGALSPQVALSLAAGSDFLGAYFLGIPVAETIGKGIVNAELMRASNVGIFVICSALLAALSWNVITWRVGFPSSSSHALMGGMIGAFVAGWGMAPVQWGNVLGIILVMLVSPLAGFALTYLFTKLTFFFSQYLGFGTNEFFKKMQGVSLVVQSLTHGANDAQKTMGVIVFGLVVLDFHHPHAGASFIPPWIVLSCSLTIALGVLLGGWKLIRRLGAGLYRIRPIHAFASQAASGSIMYLTSIFGFPISTTQVVSSSILGAGAAFRPKAVRWQVAGDMGVAWLITMPVSAFLSAGFFYASKLIFVRGIG